jgi:hypothetical protein
VENKKVLNLFKDSRMLCDIEDRAVQPPGYNFFSTGYCE